MQDSSTPSVRFWDSDPLLTRLLVITTAAFSLIVLLYIGLIPLGHWEDEYVTLHEYASGGWRSLAHRLVDWSPRPFSELMIFSYAHAVEFFHVPLIEYVLGALWFVLSACMLAFPILLLGESDWRQLRGRATALALGLLCLSLLAHPVGEMFYWPQGAIAYLPVVAGISITVWGLILTGTASWRIRFGFSVALSVAALSAEVGAMFVLVFCVLTGLCVLITGSFRDVVEREERNVAFLLVPFCAALGVAVAILLGRFQNAEEIFGDAGVARHLAPALVESVKRFLLEALSLSGKFFEPRHLLAGVIAKSLFILGAYGTLSPMVALRRISRFDQQLIGIAGLTCFATMLLVLASSYYQFGSACCERHGTFRHVLLLFGFLSCAAWLAGRRAETDGGHLRNYAAARSLVMLGASVAIPALYSIRSIASDYRHFSTHRQVQAANWEAGRATGKHFDFRVPPAGDIYGGLRLTHGTYTLADDSEWRIHSIITYFRKDSVTINNVTIDSARQ